MACIPSRHAKREFGAVSVVRHRGFSLIEMLVALALGALVLSGLAGVMHTGLAASEMARERNALNRDARFALERMTDAVARSRLLMLPLADNPLTNWPENIREQTVPPSPPVGSSTLATAVVAVTLPLDVDLDFDGVPDADDDADGRIDEDLFFDRDNDGAAGIMLIDDDGDGSVDEGHFHSDDESTTPNDDPINGVDDDNDNNIDEDNGQDMNDDGCAGICGVDDDNDGSIDEGASYDDDEDGVASEDWYNPLVFYLDNGTLMERIAVPWDENASGDVTGADFVVSALADNITRFRVERVTQGASRAQLVDLTLELTSPRSGAVVSVNARIRLGGAR